MKMLVIFQRQEIVSGVVRFVQTLPDKTLIIFFGPSIIRHPMGGLSYFLA